MGEFLYCTSTEESSKSVPCLTADRAGKSLSMRHRATRDYTVPLKKRAFFPDPFSKSPAITHPKAAVTLSISPTFCHVQAFCLSLQGLGFVTDAESALLPGTQGLGLGGRGGGAAQIKQSRFCVSHFSTRLCFNESPWG